jgi:hypothetical protein
VQGAVYQFIIDNFNNPAPFADGKPLQALTGGLDKENYATAMAHGGDPKIFAQVAALALRVRIDLLSGMVSRFVIDI